MTRIQRSELQLCFVRFHCYWWSQAVFEAPNDPHESQWTPTHVNDWNQSNLARTRMAIWGGGQRSPLSTSSNSTKKHQGGALLKAAFYADTQACAWVTTVYAWRDQNAHDRNTGLNKSLQCRSVFSSVVNWKVGGSSPPEMWSFFVKFPWRTSKRDTFINLLVAVLAESHRC